MSLRCSWVWVLVVVTAPALATQNEDGQPLTPSLAARRFDVTDGLAFEQVLAEPEVRQPLSMKFDDRGRLWIAEYIQYPYPAGLKMVSRDSYWRAVYDKKPVAPPNHVRGADRISIHEDTTGDGQFDAHSVFLEGTSITTSFAFDRDGVWVLNPPYLLFYPDTDHDDVPDADPVVHLAGFGIEDTHSCANSLCWGPDGWLYGAQGSTVSGRITRPGIDEEPVTSMGQLIWRYHPPTRRYEIFAEGGGNAFGVEFDSKGRVFSGHNGGNTRGFHYVQGGYFQKGFTKHGPLSNPYAFGYFSWMGHHNVPRFTHDFVIYEGAALPEQYNGMLFGVGPLQSHVVLAEVLTDGSTLKTKDLGHPVQSKDARFRPVEITHGPDGAIYVADFYEDQISHREHFDGQIEKDTGRIYRLKAADAKPLPQFDLSRKTTSELIDLLEHSNRWFRHEAIRLLGERKDRSGTDKLLGQIRSHQNQLALDSFWALYRTVGLSEEHAVEFLQHEYPWVRAWTVRLLCDDKRSLSSGLASALEALARHEKHPEVRSQLACSARRLPVDQALPLVAELARHDEDASDPHIPLLLWWAIEANAATHHEDIIGLFDDADFRGRSVVRQHLLERTMRRFARSGKRKGLLAAARLFDAAAEPESRTALMRGFEKAYEGRPLAGLPQQLVDAIDKAGGGSDVLKVRQRKPDAIQRAIEAIADDKAKPTLRISFIEAFRDLRHEPAVDALLDVARMSEPSVQQAALGALQSFSNEQIADRILEAYADMPTESQAVAQSLLSSRPAWAIRFLDAVESKRVGRPGVVQDVIWRLQSSQDQKVLAATRRVFGDITPETAEQLRKRVRDYSTAIEKDKGDPYAGKKLFLSNCGRCHRLFDSGGEIGPDLTSYKRDDLSRMLLNVVDPSSEIREGYESWLAITEDGRTVTGFKVDEDEEVLTLKGADGVRVSITKSDLDEVARQPISLMPTGLLDKLNEQQLRDLFAYLRSSQPLNNKP